MAEPTKHILGSYDSALRNLQNDLLMMASLCERNLRNSLGCLLSRDEELCNVTIADDEEIDQLEKTVDKDGIDLLRRFQPVAGDLRHIVAAMKLSSNLERIADQAVSIARRAKELNLQPPLKPLIDIPRMATIATEMLRDTVTAFVEEDPDLARAIIKRDKEVDEINRQLQRELTSFMLESPNTITRALQLLTISRNIERIADHAKNIAEEVYYLYRASDIRHEGSSGTPGA